jgi:hypothetical protein
MRQCGWRGLAGNRPVPGRQVGSEGEGRGTERYAGGGGDAPRSTTTTPGGRTAACWVLRDRSIITRRPSRDRSALQKLYGYAVGSGDKSDTRAWADRHWLPAEHRALGFEFSAYVVNVSNLKITLPRSAKGHQLPSRLAKSDLNPAPVNVSSNKINPGQRL